MDECEVRQISPCSLIRFQNKSLFIRLPRAAHHQDRCVRIQPELGSQLLDLA